VTRRGLAGLGLLVGLLAAAAPAVAQPPAAPITAELAFGPGAPTQFGPTDPIPLVLTVRNPGADDVLTTEGFSQVEYWRRLYFTDPLGRTVINAAEAQIHAQGRLSHCLSRSGVLLGVATPVVPVEVLRGSNTPPAFLAEYTLDDARTFFDLTQPGRYTVSARVPFQAFAAGSGDVIADCDQFPGQTVLNVGEGTSAQSFLVESNTLEFVVVNTSPGTDVAVTPVDTSTGGTPVTLTFDEVTAAGATSLTTSSAGPPPPANFTLGTPPVFYDVTTTAGFAGQVQVCISYDEAAFGTAEADLRLFHFEAGAWVDVTDAGSPDTDANVLCGHVSTLSPFAAFAGTGQAVVVADAGPDQTGVIVGRLVTLDGTGSTPAGSLTFAWTQTAGPSVVLNNATTASPSFVAAAVGTYGFELTVASGGAPGAPDAVSVQVQYAFGGFVSPKPNATFKGGKKIDVRFRLLDSAAAPVTTATGTFQMVRTDGPATPVTGAFTFNSKRREYEFQIVQKGLPRGAWRIDVTPNDGITRSVAVQLR
jgi:hypothetical protein